MVKAQRLELRKMERDKYFRINAHVVADDQDLSLLLIEAGLAVHYDGATKTKDWCADPHYPDGPLQMPENSGLGDESDKR